MDKQEEIYFSKKHSERAKAVLRLLDGMSVSEAREMLRWCADFVSDYTTVNWKREIERQEQEKEPAPETEAQEQAGESVDLQNVTKSLVINM